MKYLLLLFLSLSCGKALDDGKPTTSISNLDIETLRWGLEDFPISLKVSDNLDSQSQAIVENTLNEWERAGDINFFSPVQSTPNLNFTSLKDYYYRDRLVQGIYLANHRIDELNETSLAVTQIFYYIDSDSPSNPFYHIIHSDIVINGHDFEFSTDPSDNTKFYLLTLILHEVGHVLGVGHQTEGIMYPSMSTYDKQDFLTSFDLDLVRNKYGMATVPSSFENKLKASLPEKNEIKRALLFLPAERILSIKSLNIKRRAF